MSKPLYGYVDDKDESLKGKSGAIMKFGLNQDVRMKSFAFNPNGGADDTPGEVIDIEFEFNRGDERMQRVRIFPIDPEVIYGKKGGVLEKTDPEYPKAFETAVNMFNGYMVHILHRFADEETVKSSLSAADVVDFKSFAAACIRVLPKGYQEIPLDMFIAYSWNIRKGNDVSYLEIPKNMKQGPWLCRHIAGDFKPSEDPELNGALVYITESGEQHEFARDARFMGGNFANQQTEKSVTPTVDMSSSAPKKGKW